MKTPSRLGPLVSLVIAAAAIASACVSTPADAEDANDVEGTGQSPATVASVDGVVTLTVPAAALPAGVSAFDLSVSLIGPVEAPPPLEEQSDAAASAREIARVDLQPSGTRFEAPLPVSARLPLEVVSGPLFAYLISEDGSVEALPVATALDGETVIATTEVDHFSEIVWSVIGFREYEAMVSPILWFDRSRVVVGQTIPVEFILERLQGEQTIEMELIGRGGIETVTALVPYTVNVEGGPWQLRGVFTSRGDEVLSPAFDPQPPGEWISGTADTLTQEGSFTCRDVGYWQIWFGGAIQITYEAWPNGTLEGAELPRFEQGNHIQVLQPGFVDGSCIAPDEPPPLATENIPPNVFPIEAVLNPPVTVYAISASDPERGELTYAWSGANCGTNWGAATELFAWTHEGDDCDHTTVAHPDAAIAVTVSDGVWQVTCRYQGAASGHGEACQAPTQVQ